MNLRNLKTCIFVVMLVAASSGAKASDVMPFVAPLPTVTGPITNPPGSNPFMHSRLNLASFGYVEEEFFVSGTANVYQWTSTGVELKPGSEFENIPYTTRILVRRPTNPAKFSGNVIVEWLNPTGLLDAAILWGYSHEYFMRNGDIFVGITLKSVALDSMKTFYDPR